MIEIDEIIHQPVRTKILALLAHMEEADFNTVKKTLDLSDGHMSTHMKKLVDAEYVNVDKKFVNNKSCTTFSLTKLGKQRFDLYLENLKSLFS